METFGYISIGGSIGFSSEPADNDFKTFFNEPSDMPVFDQFGVPHRAPDGTMVYTGLPQITIQVPVIRLATDLTGAPATVGTAKELYAQYNLARGQMWLNCWSPVANAFVKVKGRLKWPDYSGKINGPILENMLLEVVAWGFGTAATGGEQNPPDTSDPENYKDPYFGGFGYGQFGVGKYGQGGLNSLVWY